METKSHKVNSILLPIYWTYIGFITVLKIIFDLLIYAFDGVVELISSILTLFKLVFIGFRFVILIPFTGIYNYSSRQVDKVYLNAKIATKIKNVGPSIAEEIPSKTPLLSKIWKLLNANIGSNEKALSQKEITRLEEKRHELQKELESSEAKKLSKAKVFVYKAKDQNGKWLDGRFIGFSKVEVNSFLLNEGYDVYSIENNKWIDFLYGDSGITLGRMSNKDLIFWLTQLSTYVKSGIPLTDAVKILMNQMGNDKSKRGIFQSVAYQLTMGESFSSALSKQGEKFPMLLINMLKAAEATGELEETLDDMAKYYSDIETTKKEMISAITYPVLVTIFAFGVILFILLYVIPKFQGIYETMGVGLSGLTLFLLNTSIFLKDYGMIILLIIFIIILINAYLYKRIKSFRRAQQIFMMKLPVFGNIIIYNEMTIFAKTFASLLRNNVNITESVDILSKITNNEIYKEIMVNTINNIAKGDKISQAFKGNWAVPDVAYYMIVTGESTGQLAEMMTRVSDYYQEQHHNLVTNLKAFIEPVMITVLAVVVGGIILSVIIPMFDMYQTVSIS
jgi:type IV pilus assembly protein PilC